MNRTGVFKSEIFVTFLLSCYVVITAAGNDTCDGGVKTCEWFNWMPWESCDKPCGGGMSHRQRNLCCKEEFKFLPYACLNNCNYQGSDTYQFGACNQFCYNGGTFNGVSCECQPGTMGVCCENGTPIIQTQTPALTTISTTTTTTEPTTKTPTGTTEPTTKTPTGTTEPTTKTPTGTTEPITKSTIKTTKSTDKTSSEPTTKTTTTTTKATAKTSTELTTKTSTETTRKATTKTSTEPTTKTTKTSKAAAKTSTETTTQSIISTAETKTTDKTTTDIVTLTSPPTLHHKGASKVKQDCINKIYTDCRCLFGAKKTKTRSLLRDVEFSGYGAIIGFLFSFGTYLFWNCCEGRKNYRKSNDILPSGQFRQ